MADVLAVGLPLGRAADDRWRVLQRVRDEVLVLEVEDEDVPALAAQAALVLRRRAGGAVDVLGDEAVLADLDAGARLFVSSWRSSSQKRDRPGEGLSWDAQGFQAP